MSRINALPEDVQNMIWKLHYNHVIKELLDKFYWSEPPTLEFLQSLQIDDQIRYLTDYGWETGNFHGLDPHNRYMGTIPYYLVSVSKGVWTRKSCRPIHPLRPISKIVLHDHLHLQKQKVDYHHEQR